MAVGLLFATLAGACADSGPPAAAQRDEGARDSAATLQDDVDTLLAAVSALDAVVELDRAALRVDARFERITATVDALAIAATELRDAASTTAADQLSIRAAQIAPQLRALKRAVLAASLDDVARRELLAALARVKVAARSLDLSAGEQYAHAHAGSPLHTIDQGHIDAVDAAFEDGALGITIHDETVDPDVERDPADVLLVVKPSAKLQVPDDRFGFLGPAGTTVWILPENELDAAAAELLFAGLSSEEIELGTFVGDTVEIRFKQVIGPDGFSLFESPPDDTTPPVVLVDSENGLPDAVALPAGTHRHANWAFEAAGTYFIKVDVRGRLAGVAGTPWVTSSTATLRFRVRA